MTDWCFFIVIHGSVTRDML